MGKKPLPITYYDVVMEHQWRRFRHAIRADAERLRSVGESGPIDSVDSFDSAMVEAARLDVREMASAMGERLGVGTEAALAMMAQHQPGLLESFMASYNYAYHSVLNFELAGRKTFFVRDGLAERLLATEIASDSELIRLPFKACQFVFTAPGVVQALGLMEASNGSPLHLAYDMPVSVFASELDSPAFGGRSLILLVAQASPSSTRSMLKRQLLLAPGRSLEEALHTDWEAIRARAGVGDTSVGKRISGYGADVSEVTDTPFFTDGLLIFRLVLNAILYLSSDRAEVVDRAGPLKDAARKMNHAERRAAAKNSRLGYANVGESVPPIYVDARNNLAGPGGPVAGQGMQRLQHRLLVRGHWKHQAHGSQSAERKLIWIEPYLRGPDVAEAVNKPYVVR